MRRAAAWGSQRKPRRVPAWLPTWVLLAATACASPGMPPGGPPDSDAPVIRRVVPDSNAVNVRANAVLVHFDEVISERSSAQGGGGGRPGTAGGASGGAGAAAGAASGLATLVDLSPTDGREEVRWRRTALEIRPRGGFRPNTTYRVTVLPGIADLRGNILRERLSFAFSTGESVPEGVVDGVVFDWAAGAPAARARVELFLPADSTFRWVTTADSSGRFRLQNLAAGSYALRAWVDETPDRRIGLREISDTATVALDSARTLELYAFLRDTIAPFLDQVERVDSVGLRVRFARAVQPEWDPSGSVTILDADSVAVVEDATLIPLARFDSLLAARRPAADSLAGDSLAVDSARADTTAARDPLRPARDARPALRAPDDTLPPALPPPTFGREKPIVTFGLLLERPLPPGLYTLQVSGAPGLNGAQALTSRGFRVPEPAPPPEPERP